MFGLGKEKDDMSEYNLEDALNNIMKDLPDLPEAQPSSETSEDPRIAKLKTIMVDAKELLLGALSMEEQGPDAATPLARILDNEVIAGCLVSIMMSPTHNELEKVRLATALICVAMKKYEIAL